MTTSLKPFVIQSWHSKASEAVAVTVSGEVMVQPVSAKSLHLSPAHDAHPPGQKLALPQYSSESSPRQLSTSLRRGPPTGLQLLRKSAIDQPLLIILQFRCSLPVRLCMCICQLNMLVQSVVYGSITLKKIVGSGTYFAPVEALGKKKSFFSLHFGHPNGDCTSVYEAQKQCFFW